MKRTTLCIRADASAEIGVGHLMRCFALAQAWLETGGDIQLLTSASEDGLLQCWRDARIAVVRIAATRGSAEDAVETAAVARANQAEWVVLDGYHFDDSYRVVVKAAGVKVMVVDDLGASDLRTADVILNQNSYAAPEHYPHASARLFLGGSYALVRREFRMLDRQRKPDEGAARVLVMAGGSDPANITARLMGLLGGTRLGRCRVTIVVGAANRHLAALRDALPQLQRTHDAVLTVNPSALPSLMAEHDVALSAAGSTAWELAALGVPMVLVVAADNQTRIASHLAAVGAAEALPADDTAAVSLIEALIADPSRRRELARKAGNLIDGLGACRVAEQLWADPITLRPATATDAGRLYEWANDPVVRQMSFSSDEIPWETHQRWFQARLGSADSRLYIALDGASVPVGVVRFERKSEVATVGIAVDQGHRGRGYAPKIARLGARTVLFDQWCRVVRALVKPANHGSVKTFTTAGYEERPASEATDASALVFELEATTGCRERSLRSTLLSKTE